MLLTDERKEINFEGIPYVDARPERFLFLNRDSHPRVVTKRFVLYLGFKCNLRCQFCYYLKSLEEGTAKNFTFEQLKRKITVARWLGKEDIDFTGGEPTMHPDFPKLIAHAKAIGFKTINVITNGWRLADKKVFDSFVAQGLNEVLFSFHSHDEKLHDEMTQVKGSYKKILAGIQHARDMQVRVRLNSVVSPMNLGVLDQYMEFVRDLRPHSVNLIVFNPSEETIGYKGHENVRLPSYEDIGRDIGSALAKYKDDFPVVNVRFLPFCFAKGQETHLRTYWQEIYERQEWDPLLHWAFRKNWFLVLGASALGFGLSLVSKSNVWKGEKNLYARVCEFFQLFRVRYLYVQKKECGGCQLKKICPGIPRDFHKANPAAKVFPYTKSEVPEIVNPSYFGHRYPEKFDSVAEAMRREFQ